MKMIGGRFRAAVLMGAAASMLALAAGAKTQDRNSKQCVAARRFVALRQFVVERQSSAERQSLALHKLGALLCWRWLATSPASQARSRLVRRRVKTAAGTPLRDLFASQAATAKQIENMKPDLLALVGDEQYQVGQYSDFENSYELTYGAFKFITRPAPGNHEFYNEHGAVGVAGYGYFSYFNGVQHNPDGIHNDGYDCQQPRHRRYLHPTRAVRGWTGGALRANGRTRKHSTGGGPRRGRRWLVFL